MKIHSLNCNNCGAQLQVPDAARFVTCGHCDSQLAVHRNDSVWYTEKLNQLSETTSEIAEHVARLSYRSELERVDAQWEQEREQYIATDTTGNEVPPSTPAGSFAALASVGLMTIIFGIAFHYALIFVGLLVIAGGVYAYVSIKSINRDYKRAHRAYLRRRGRVRIEDFRPKSSGKRS